MEEWKFVYIERNGSSRLPYLSLTRSVAAPWRFVRYKSPPRSYECCLGWYIPILLCQMEGLPHKTCSNLLTFLAAVACVGVPAGEVYTVGLQDVFLL